MTPEQMREAYLEWIEGYCNNEFDEQDLPGGIKLALDKLVEMDPLSFNVTSEKLSDMGQTFASDGGIPKFIYHWIDPYKRVKSL